MCQESGQGRHRQERLSSVLLVALDSVLEQEQALVLRQMLERELALVWCTLEGATAACSRRPWRRRCNERQLGSWWAQRSKPGSW